MKKYLLLKGSTDMSSLKLIECDQPQPAAGQVLIRVHAASLNYRDHAVVSGKYFGGVLQRDTVPLSDGAGEVVAVGDGVSRIKAGDRVAGNFFQGSVDGVPDRASLNALGSPADGMLAEYVLLDEQGVVAIPEHLSWEEGASLPCAAVTAWNALMVSGSVRPGDTVLMLGTGGVSIFALQFAKISGARAIITSSDDAKLEKAKSLRFHRRIPSIAEPRRHRSPRSASASSYAIYRTTRPSSRNNGRPACRKSPCGVRFHRGW
jgi:NADPH:quinone reductase-like Zn-dependent oxidoreductase